MLQGITGFQDAYCDAQVYHEAEKRGFLTARVTGAMITAPEKSLSEQISAFQKARKQFSGQYFKPSALKIFLDGVMETDTASLFEPYCSHHHDALIWNPKKLQKLMQKADQKQFQLHFHAIGDRAVHAALDVIQQLEHQKPRDRRSLIAHLQLIHPDDIKRFGQLPVVPVFQAFWAQRDKDMLATLPKLGPKRARWLYPIKSLADSGAILALGSDWHVSTVNPLEAIQVAITRQPLGKKTQKP